MAALGYPSFTSLADPSGLGEEGDLEHAPHHSVRSGMKVDLHTRDARDSEEAEQMEFDAQLDELEAAATVVAADSDADEEDEAKTAKRVTYTTEMISR